MGETSSIKVKNPAVFETDIVFNGNKRNFPYRLDDEDEDVSSNNEVTLYTSHLIIQVLLNI